MIPLLVLTIFCAAQTLFFSRRALRASLVASLGVAVVLASAVYDLGAASRIAGVALVVLASLSNAARMVPTSMR